MNLIILETQEVQPDGRALLADKRAEHILKILKAGIGQTLRVGVVNGRLGTGIVESIEAGRVTLQCTLDQDPPPEPVIDLLLALPRPLVMKRLWAPIASLGVRKLFLTTAARVERNYFDTHWLLPENHRPLLVEGLAQAADTRLPEVSIIRRLKPFIEDELDLRSPGGRRLLAHPDSPPFRPEPRPPDEPTLLAIGPEGGWVDFELDMLETHGFTRIGMGRRILRTDTACIALLSLLRAG